MDRSKTLRRRDYLKLSGAGIAGGLTGCLGGGDGGDGDGGDGDGDGGGTATGTPMGGTGIGSAKIGLAVPTSGAFGFLGADFQRGFELRIEEINQSDEILPNSELEVAVEDTGSDPGQALEVTRSLVQQQGIDLLVGGANSEGCFSISQFMAGENLPFFMAMCGDFSLTSGERCEWTNARLVPHNGTYTKAQPVWSVNNLGERAYCLYPDYATGQTQQQFVEPAIEGAGGEVAESTFAPLGNQEWGPILEDIISVDPDWLFFGMVASGQVPFLNQAANRDYNIPLSGTLLLEQISGQLTEELIDQLPPLYRATRYTREFDNEINQSFVENYIDSYDRPPVYASGYGYMNGSFIANAYTAAGSKETEPVMQVVEDLEWTDLVGNVKVRACDHQASPAGAISQIVGVDTEHKLGKHDIVHKFSAEEIQGFQPSCDEIECSFDR
jgi:branched-chain amino acid transport system substrate-binding protein